MMQVGRIALGADVLARGDGAYPGGPQRIIQRRNDARLSSFAQEPTEKVLSFIADKTASGEFRLTIVTGATRIVIEGIAALRIGIELEALRRAAMRRAMHTTNPPKE